MVTRRVENDVTTRLYMNTSIIVNNVVFKFITKNKSRIKLQLEALSTKILYLQLCSFKGR